jgi:hypothetical protein
MIMACMYVLEMGIPATESLLGASINHYTETSKYSHWNKRCLLLELLYISWSLNVSIVHRYRHCNIRNECLRQIPLHKPQDRQKSYQISCRLELFLLAMIVDLAFYTKVLFDQAYCTSSL